MTGVGTGFCSLRFNNVMSARTFLPDGFNHIGVLFTIPKQEDERMTMARHHTMFAPFGYNGQPFALEQGHMIRGGHKLLPLEFVDGGVNPNKKTDGWKMTGKGIEISVQHPGYAEDTLAFFQEVMPLSRNKGPKIHFVQGAPGECADWHLGLHFPSYADMDGFVEYLKIQGNLLAFEFAANYIPVAKKKSRQNTAVFKVTLHGVVFEMSFGQGGPPHELNRAHRGPLIANEDPGKSAYTKHAPVGGLDPDKIRHVPKGGGPHLCLRRDVRR